MKTHPYLRAYMAGIAFPTMGLLVAMTVFCIARLIYHIPIPIERVIIFPVALVPNAWGVWNILYVWLHSRRPMAIGLHGAVLPFLIAPVALTVSRLLDVAFMTRLQVVAIVLPVGVVIYYLLWKHLVAFFNEVLGIA